MAYHNPYLEHFGRFGFSYYKNKRLQIYVFVFCQCSNIYFVVFH